MSGPLEGFRIVDCSRGTAGTRATGLFADYGADVIWVEPPSGDPYRQELANYYAAYNRGKRSVVLDLHQRKDHQSFLDLVAGADVMLNSWRPGVAERLGLSYEDLHTTLPRLVHTSISGFGPDNARRGLQGYEALVHAVIGTMGEQRGWRPGPIFEGLPFASFGASSLAVIGTLAALYRRDEDGIGRQVETSLIDGALAYLAMAWADTDVPMPMMGAASKRIVVDAFRCSDGEYLGVHTGAVGAFGRLMQVLGLDDRIPPSTDGLDMALTLTPEEEELLQRELPRLFVLEPRRVWLERCLRADVCAIPVMHAGDVFDEPQAVHNQMVVEVTDPVFGPIQQVAPAARFSLTPATITKAAPTPGQHTDAVLAELARSPRYDAEAPAAPGAEQSTLLAGVRILDFGAYFAGPYASRLLADLGAEVVKIETLGGDPLRGQERVFPSGHAGKKSIAIDMKSADGQAIGQKLASWADVVQHNMRPGAAERLGLGYRQVLEVNPEVVYAYSPGWGSTGPDNRRQGFAPMYSGYVGVSFEVAGRGNPPIMPLGNEDPGNGLLGAIGILMALLHRRRSGRGQFVEHAQLNATMAHLTHILRRPNGSLVGAASLDREQLGTGPLNRLYQTADGWVCIVAVTDGEVDRLREALDLGELAVDRHLATREARSDRPDDLARLLEAAFSKWTTADATTALGKAGVAFAVPVPHNCEAFLNDPENFRTGRVVESPHPTRGTIREVGKMIRVSDAAIAAHRRAPALGEHTDEILSGLGYSSEDIIKFRTSGVAR